MHGCEDDEFDSTLLPLLFRASCLRFGSVPTKSRSELLRWHLSSKGTPRPYFLPESTSIVSALRFLLTESKFPWRHRTRSRSLCWYLQPIVDHSGLIFHRGEIYEFVFAESRIHFEARIDLRIIFPNFKTREESGHPTWAKDTTSSKWKLFKDSHLTLEYARSIDRMHRLKFDGTFSEFSKLPCLCPCLLRLLDSFAMKSRNRV